MLLKPFYFFDSGSPQISDFIVLPAMALYFIKNRPLSLIKEKAVRYILAFLGLVCFVNIIYATLVFEGYQWTFLKPIFYYSYNIVLFFFFLSLFKPFVKKDYVILLWVFFGSLLIQYAMILLDIDKGVVNNFQGRDYNFFNNPNQLSYYSIVVLTMLFFIRKHVLDLPYLFSLCVSLSLVIILCATSFPTLVGGVILLLLYFLIIAKQHFLKHLFLLVFPLLLLVLVKKEDVSREYERITARFENPEKRMNATYADRGYDRLFEFPEYVLYGAGEGMNERFVPQDIKRPQEIHNLFGNILFSYGIFGCVLFLMFLYHVFSTVSKVELLYLVPLLLYNMVHNGVRFSFVWVLFALILIRKKKSIDYLITK
ncbi:hypothetical protein SCB49_12154 [unidentified eubacterium SCB49]|nr:hypothetical protein SCB49_12154 [unidentified eubacterium SCB49]